MKLRKRKRKRFTRDSSQHSNSGISTDLHWCRRPVLTLVLVSAPPVVAAVVMSSLYYFTVAFVFPVLMATAIGYYLVGGLEAGELSDNWGNAIRQQAPLAYWWKMTVWSGAYLFVLAWIIGYALQEHARLAAGH